MTTFRLLAAFILLGSSFTFAQSLGSSEKPVMVTKPQSAAVAQKPWKILPDREASAADPQATLEASQYPKDWAQPNLRADVIFPPRGFVIPPSAPMDGACFAIRSYVVARDSKNSDSTHPVGYSTCVPANKYRIRKVDASAESIQLQQDSR